MNRQISQSTQLSYNTISVDSLQSNISDLGKNICELFNAI